MWYVILVFPKVDLSDTCIGFDVRRSGFDLYQYVRLSSFPRTISNMALVTIYGGMGRHTADLDPAALVITLKVYFHNHKSIAITIADQGSPSSPWKSSTVHPLV